MNYGTVTYSIFVILTSVLDLIDRLLKGSKVRNQSVRLDLLTRAPFTHQWSEYQIKGSKIIALNKGFGFQYKTLLYH